MGVPEELIAESTAYGETDDPEILAARAQFKELNEKYKEQIRPEAEAVCAAGGLFILGTERHESRRIDNQLRGRAGRQGDPGASRFFLSLEDDLMRLFGGSRVDAMMEMLGVDEDTPIEAKMLTNAVESAQRRLEERNFGIRRDVLKYDDVMNKQREVIYGQRDDVLADGNVRESIIKMIESSIAANVAQYADPTADHERWNLDGLRSYYLGWLTTEEDFRYTAQELEDTESHEITTLLTDRAMQVYEAKEQKYGDFMREIERVMLLRTVDNYWMEHIDNMDELRRGIHLRAIGQHDPVVVYRNEGFDMFEQMVAAIREDTARIMLTVEIQPQQPLERKQVAKETGTSADGTDKKQPVRKKASEKVGRNDPCPCGSGKKYKQCCGR